MTFSRGFPKASLPACERLHYCASKLHQPPGLARRGGYVLVTTPTVMLSCASGTFSSARRSGRYAVHEHVRKADTHVRTLYAGSEGLLLIYLRLITSPV